MQALFVHGMGRSPFSGWPMLRRLRRAGLPTSTFGYFVSLEKVDGIVKRLVDTLVRLAEQHDYVVIGHSLGGVLLREAIHRLPAGVRRPRHVFLVGSPVHPARLARYLRDWLAFRLLTRDCGQLLGSTQRMAAIGPLSLPTTAIVGTKGLAFQGGPFGGAPNDGVVAVSEVVADWLTDQAHISVPHVWLPASRQVADIVLERLSR